MARKATESDFRIFKMAGGSYLFLKMHKIKIAVLIWNGKKCDTKWFLDIRNCYRRPFTKKNICKKVVRVIWTMFEPTAGRLQLGINIYIGPTYRQLCWEWGNIHCVRPLGRMHTILDHHGFMLKVNTCGGTQSWYTSLHNIAATQLINQFLIEEGCP